ncbi:hypothetical protein ACJ73_05313 [Blastomyces percursus]|uniref:Uncharacterized protein n=1 Tax=Blastomyces percursus TaxID=1658174 RepID=A0A1J9Q3U9_9EURO|nr:hypothetical protein ACJ73_05313 [Blastomyces percursus]
MVILPDPGASVDTLPGCLSLKLKKSLKQLLSQRLLLLQYAVPSILEHARFIESEPEEEAFIDGLPWDYWIYFPNVFVGRKAHRYALGESLRALAKIDKTGDQVIEAAD